jgi:hypothetical protein
MVKLKYNSKNVDRSGSNVTPPRPGSYQMKVTECKFEEDNGSHPDRLVFISAMQVADSDGNGKGYRFWDYVNLDIDWKVDQWLQAAGVDTEKRDEGEFDTKQFKNLMVLGRVKEDQYKGEYRPKLAGVFQWVNDEDLDEFEEEYDEDVAEEEDYDEVESEDEDEVEEEFEEEDEDWDEEEEEPEPKPKPRKKAPTKKAAAKRKPAPEPEEVEDDYDEWSVADLRGECKERGLAVSGGKSALIVRLRKNDADPFDEGDDD